LKKTNEFGEQASLLEKEYEKLFDENNIHDPIMTLVNQDSSAEKTDKQPEFIEKCGVKFPKLDFT